MSLDPVLQRLTNDIPQAGYDRRSLAQLVLHLQQFMEIALGINVSPASKLALRSFSPAGVTFLRFWIAGHELL